MKAWKIIKTIVYWCLIALSATMLIFTIISATTLDKNNRSLFGLKIYSVLSDSMSATDFKAGDLIFVVNVDDASKLKEGDIISFISCNPDDSYGEVVTHKIRTKTTDAQGKPGFITYGTTSGVDDETIVTYPYVLGKYVGRVPAGGYFFEFLKTTGGYICCILIPLLLLIVSQGINSVVLFRKYKQEQNTIMEEEKASIQREKEENKRILEELTALKRELEEKNKNNKE